MDHRKRFLILCAESPRQLPSLKATSLRLPYHLERFHLEYFFDESPWRAFPARRAHAES